jgi:hypothetical protein
MDSIPLYVPTKADAARTRNWGIRNLRALYALSYQVQGERGAGIRALIDDELVARGALTTAQRDAKALAEFLHRRAKANMAAHPEMDEEVPF